ncbi:HNH endonuclease [Bradyrhizobium sp. USDA 4451]
MSLDRILKHVSETSLEPESYWRKADLVAMSSTPPDSILSRNDTVLRADAYALWFRWFIQGVCNPLRYVEDDRKTIVDVMADALPRVSELYRGEPEGDRFELATGIAKHVMAEVDRRRKIGRINAAASEKRDLVDAALGQPRCWVCGFEFSKAAVDLFLRKKTGAKLVLPSLVDIFRPRGLIDRDIKIEVEHIVPVASGGGGKSNLALSCGWCNKSKGALTSLYDADAHAPLARFKVGATSWHELPHPFWTVRLLAIQARCEFSGHGGCTATSKTDELFIAPSDHRGSPNPSNLHVFCTKHDPYAADRFVNRTDAAQIWKSRKRAS